MKKERSILDKHVQTVFGERESKRKSHMVREKPVTNSLSYAKIPLADFPLSQKSAQKRDRDFDSSYPRGHKGKRAKVYHSLPMSYGELLPVLIQNYGISVILAMPRRLPYPKGYDVNAICEYHGGVGGHSVENCTTFKDKV